MDDNPTPQPADAALLAKANRALHEQLEEARAEVERLRSLAEEAFREGWTEGFDVGGSGTDMNPEDVEQRDLDWLDSKAKDALAARPHPR